MDRKNGLELVLKGRIYDLAQPLIMAIINATDDSFYAASRNKTDDSLRRCIEKAITEGADILDVGGCSTRPGGDFVSEQEEMERVSHTLYIIKELAPDIPTSVDTFRASVARMAVLDFGCDLVNDISGFALDSDMLNAVVELQKPYILTHNPLPSNKNRPNDIVKSPVNLPEDKFLSSVLQYFAEKVDVLRSAGFDNDIIIDPGFGFGKSIEENYSLLRNLSLFDCFHEPILVGVSRKSMIYKTLNISAEEALNGTTVLNTVGILNGANILRVHDVREGAQIRDLAKHII